MVMKYADSIVKVESPLDSFLKSLGLEKYSITFQEEEKVDMTALRHMTDSDLKALGIPMGQMSNQHHRKHCSFICGCYIFEKLYSSIPILEVTATWPAFLASAFDGNGFKGVSNSIQEILYLLLVTAFQELPFVMETPKIKGSSVPQGEIYHDRTPNNQRRMVASVSRELPPLGLKGHHNEQLTSNGDKPQSSVQSANNILNYKQVIAVGNGTVDTLTKSQYVNVVSQGSNIANASDTDTCSIANNQVLSTDSKHQISARGSHHNLYKGDRIQCQISSQHPESVFSPRPLNLLSSADIVAKNNRGIKKDVFLPGFQKLHRPSDSDKIVSYRNDL
ncbi:hypothetical protein GUJ93_ZPchr0007g5615 [Zizania palustris]|uniref:SAM domain-containing protein n=1 Tax=Zizania palustris TaxID=103762 RepID=A0A8J5VTC7_ZIZPA|nr:hypothetical protein GUJ93_ZPchr0007g5615 [Zizania palustris]